jgi:hypothetical protein
MSAYEQDLITDVQQFLATAGYPVKSIAKEKFALFHCPACQHTHTDHTYKAHVTLDTGFVRCWRGCYPWITWDEFAKQYFSTIRNDVEFSHKNDRSLLESAESEHYATLPDYLLHEIDSWEAAFNRGKYNELKDIYEWFKHVRGFTDETIAKLRIGWTGSKISLPIFDNLGNLVSIKYRVDPRIKTSRGPKMWSEVGSHGTLFNMKILENDLNMLIIAEGEWDAALLEQYGYPAVSGTTGASSFKDAWVEAIKNVPVVYICYDADKAGDEGSLEVAAKLHALNVDVRFIVLPDDLITVQGKDITDYIVKVLQGKDVNKKINKLIKEAKTYAEHTSREEGNVERIFKYLNDRGVHAFKVEFRAQKFFFTDPNDSIQAYDLYGEEFGQKLRSWYYNDCQRGLNDATVDNVRNLLAAKALNDADKNGPSKIAIRYHREGYGSSSVIYFNIGDGKRCVKIDRDGFTIQTSSPVRFLGSVLDYPQIDPDPYATETDFLKVLDYTNLSTQADRLLFLTYIVSAVVPEIRHNVFAISGPQQTGKSTHLSICRTLVDPSYFGPIDPIDGGLYSNAHIEKRESIQQLAQWAYCMYFDNLTHLPNDISAYMCSLVTGAADISRALYTNNQPYPLVAQPLIGMNGISLVAKQPDLLSRALLFETAQMEKFTDETVFWQRFKEQKPLILGGLYKTVAKAIELYDIVPQQNKMRLGACEHFMRCAAIALGFSDEEFNAAIDLNETRRQEGSVDSSIVAENFITFMELELGTFIHSIKDAVYVHNHRDVPGYDPTFLDWDRASNQYRMTIQTTELFKKLQAVARDHTGNDKSFPNEASVMSRRLMQVAHILEKGYGIKIDQSKRTKNKRGYLITISEDKANQLIS